MSALRYWIWMTSRKGVDPTSVLTVLEYFGIPERAYFAQQEEYEAIPLRPAVRESFLDKTMTVVDQILDDCDRLRLRIVTYQDADYPERLREIGDAPAVLYVRGTMIPFDEHITIGIVGARRPTPYGIHYTRKFAGELVQNGAVIVSGIAEGLDTCAIEGALQAGGCVVSVLAGGVDRPFPPQNAQLYERVAASGALISEYPPGTPHRGYHFPVRNRIISGLSLGVLAVECRTRGGTMVTLRHTLEQNRDVFVVPGSLDMPMSRGPNRLLQQGGKLITCVEDILEEYRGRYSLRLSRSLREIYQTPVQEERKQPTWEAASQRPRQETRKLRRSMTKEEQGQLRPEGRAILSALQHGEQTIDELELRTQIPARNIMTELTLLQIEWVVQERPGGRFEALVELEQGSEEK